jgi:glycosyltransferase involved in cell wall biosynthesis
VGVFSKFRSHGLRVFSGTSQPAAQTTDPPRLLFISHEATRTGAPMIALNIVREFHTRTIASCDSILHMGGHLAERFCQYGKVDCLNVPRQPGEELTKKVRRAVLRSKTPVPALAICNSMESRFIAYELEKMGVPILFLIHELPSSYSLDDYQAVIRCARHVVFPAETVRAATAERVSIPLHKVSVLPQGLLNPEFGTRIQPDVARRQIRHELRIPHDSFVVLGCGTLDLRKGIDHFAAVARHALQRKSFGRPVHFVWVGEGPRWTHSPYHYVQLDLEKAGIHGHVHFVGERENVEPFFVASDVFLLTSRVDPFPCVIHEAMAAQLPIITFDESGGAVEALAEGAGIVVPYGDYTETVAMIRLLMEQPAIAQSLGRRSHERVHSKYQFGCYVDRLIDVSESITQRTLRKEAPATPGVPLRRDAA